jgi:hypothetical protein
MGIMKNLITARFIQSSMWSNPCGALVIVLETEIFYNTYWRVFDKGGILSTFEIRQYLIRERCRVQGISAGVIPSKEACFGCCIQFESCLCSPSRSCPYISKEIDCRKFLHEAIMRIVGDSGFVLETLGPVWESTFKLFLEVSPPAWRFWHLRNC